jgi:tRNA(His) 5'-end guanylyltransferase
LHGIDDFKVRVVRLLETDALGPIGEISYFDSYFIVLVDFDVLEDYFCWDYFEALGVDGLML